MFPKIPEGFLIAQIGSDGIARTAFIDFAMMSVLLVAGQLLRSRIGVLQKWRIPASIIAGGLVLLLGSNGWNVLAISSSIRDYPEILVVLIFAAIPIGMKSGEIGKMRGDVREMFLHVCFGILAQYGLGLLLGLLLLRAWSDLDPGFGFVLGIGFWGGPGTTAAAASAFEAAERSREILSLGLTAWMVGSVTAIVLGTVLVNLYLRREQGGAADTSAQLGDDSVSGWIPESRRQPLGMQTVSSASIDSLAWHLAIIMSVAVAGWFGSELLRSSWPGVKLPAFGVALIFGFLLHCGLRISDTELCIDSVTVHRIAGTVADYLIVAGIGSIEIQRVVLYAGPLAILLGFGVALSVFQLFVLGPRMFQESWFEKSILVFGMNTGTLAQGITLLRMVDPEQKSRALTAYGVVDFLIKPLTMGMVIVGPMMIISGYTLLLGLTCSLLAFVSLVAAALWPRRNPSSC